MHSLELIELSSMNKVSLGYVHTVRFRIVFYCLEVNWNSLGIVEQYKAMQKRYRVHVALV